MGALFHFREVKLECERPVNKAPDKSGFPSQVFCLPKEPAQWAGDRRSSARPWENKSRAPVAVAGLLPGSCPKPADWRNLEPGEWILGACCAVRMSGLCSPLSPATVSDPATTVKSRCGRRRLEAQLALPLGPARVALRTTARVEPIRASQSGLGF